MTLWLREDPGREPSDGVGDCGGAVTARGEWCRECVADGGSERRLGVTEIAGVFERDFDVDVVFSSTTPSLLISKCVMSGGILHVGYGTEGCLNCQSVCTGSALKISWGSLAASKLNLGSKKNHLGI